MKLELKKMYLEDQKLQIWDSKKEQYKSYRDSMENQFNLLCERNLIVAKNYFGNYGFPGIKDNGKEAALNFWLIVQHSDTDVAFQKKVLKTMKRELDNKNVNTRNYAFLYDRVKKNEKKPQLYGTQIVWDSKGIPSPYKLQSPKKLNKLRAKMNLEPIDEYLKSLNH